MTSAPESSDWRILAEQASTELDTDKLTDLIAKLCTALDRRKVSGESLRATLKIGDIAA
jgi:hypothetical protein